jgi:hypothetical protein
MIYTLSLIFDNIVNDISIENDIPTIENTISHLKLKENKNANHNHHNDEKVLVLKFWNVLQQ